MDKAEAREFFEVCLEIPCPECSAKVGELCDVPILWVHRDRILLSVKEDKDD